MSSAIRKPAYHCPSEAAIGVLGGRWKLLILAELVGGARRFSELSSSLPRVTDKVLTSQLRELEADGVVSRVVHYEFPPRVEYVLSSGAGDVKGLIEALDAWGTAFLDSQPHLVAQASSMVRPHFVTDSHPPESG